MKYWRMLYILKLGFLTFGTLSWLLNSKYKLFVCIHTDWIYNGEQIYFKRFFLYILVNSVNISKIRLTNETVRPVWHTFSVGRKNAGSNERKHVFYDKNWLLSKLLWFMAWTLSEADNSYDKSKWFSLSRRLLPHFNHVTLFLIIFIEF